MCLSDHTAPRRPGFSLLELLVVVGIITALIGLLLPAVQRVRDTGARVQCGNHLRQLGLALHGYHDSHKALPPGVRGGGDRYRFLSWISRVLPYLDQQPLWEQAQRDYARQPRPWAGPEPHVGLIRVMPLLVCPADGRTQGRVEPEGFDPAFTHYLGVLGRDKGSRDGVLYLDSRVAFRAVRDGTSNTLMVGERPPSPDNRFGWWYAGVGQEQDGSADMVQGVEDYRTTFRAPTCRYGPYYFSPGSDSNMCDTFHFWSQHLGGAHFLFVDGSTRFLAYSAAPLMPALATRAGGEVVSLPE